MTDTITITGNVAADPEHFRTGAGLPITRFGVVTNERRFDKDSGRWIDGASNYYRVSTFRGLADNAFASLRKGERVIVSGRLRINKWENETTTGTTVEIDAESVGHDLLFGRTVYQRTIRSGGSESQPAPGAGGPGIASAAESTTHPSAPEPVPSNAAGDEWSTPGVDAEKAPEPAAVGALALEETPF